MPAVTTRTVLAAWWPLAASWLLMALELPMVSAVVARLPDPAVHLAAHGGVVVPLAMLIEGPVIMFLAASTALSRDRPSYRRLGRWVHGTAAALTLVHALIAFTPLFDVVTALLETPAEVREPARLGLMLMLPWTWSIASRRYQQGLLIRCGESRSVSVGTGVRLLLNATVLALGWRHGRLPGVAVAALAVSAGVIAEALFIAVRARAVARERLPAGLEAEAMGAAAFVRFYVPLAITPFLTLGMQPVVSAGLGRMPRPLDSLAAWPVLAGLLFLSQCVGFAYNEVVVALLDRPGAEAALRRFARTLAVATSLVLLVLAATPLAGLWFAGLSGLEPGLAGLARRALWLALPLPATAVLLHWHQGILVHGGRTRAVPEAVLAYVAVTVAAVVAGGGIL